uniref:Uncharacterized protein n=1 Tax=Podoviridae sp. ctxqo3 TaxID=2827755 RepID=A0A8S5SZ85_9CAUD|nr:MAG TPA: hypothetical protein [Podoviridae sp. ctxqo3]
MLHILHFYKLYITNICSYYIKLSTLYPHSYPQHIPSS